MPNVGYLSNIILQQDLVDKEIAVEVGLDVGNRIQTILQTFRNSGLFIRKELFFTETLPYLIGNSIKPTC
jgi:hypothetical protein